MSRPVLGHVDEPRPGPTPPGPVMVRGWALGRDARVVRVLARVDGADPVPLGLFVLRPDVAAEYSWPGAVLSGYEGWVDVPPGTPADIRVTAELDDGTTFSLGSVTLDVDPLLDHAPRVLVWARSLDLGGSQLRMGQYADALARRDVEVTVVAAHDGPLRADLESSGVTVELADWAVPAREAGYDVRVAAAADRVRGRFDVLVGGAVTSFPVVDVGAATATPVVLRVGEAEPLDVVARWLALDWTPGLARRARRAFALADAVVVNSAAAARVHEARGWAARYVLLEEGVDLGEVDDVVGRRERRLARRGLGVATSSRLVVCLATLWPVKGQATLLEAFARVDRPALRLALVGQQDEAYAEALRGRIDDLGLKERVRIEPFAPDPALWLRAADALVSASVSESTSASVLEAMAHGLPVLATRVGGNPEIVETGVTGWLCAPSDVEDLARGLESVAAASPDELARLGSAGRRVIEARFDRSANLSAWCDVVLGTAARGPAPARQ